MSYKQWFVHFIAKCTNCNCDFRTEDCVHGPKLTAAHALETGHFVRGKMVYGVQYDADSREEEER